VRRGIGKHPGIPRQAPHINLVSLAEAILRDSAKTNLKNHPFGRRIWSFLEMSAKSPSFSTCYKNVKKLWLGVLTDEIG
jgi:hypothetical protein